MALSNDRINGAPTEVPPTGDDGRTSRVGYVASALFALIGLYVANNLLDWDILPFLTDDFEDVLPLINLSFGVNLVVSLARAAYPSRWFVQLSDIVSIGFGLPALFRTWSVFPFDFSSFPWELAVRMLLVVAIVGSFLGMIAAAVRLMAGLFRD